MAVQRQGTLIRVWRATVDARDWLFDDLDQTMAFVRAEISLGAKGATVASEWMEEDTFRTLVEKEEA